MKYIFFLPFFVLQLFVSGQNPIYHKVKIFADNAGLKKIAESGVCVDHGEHKINQWLITEIPVTDVDVIKNLGYSVEILQEDMSSFYANRNSGNQKNIGNPQALAVSCDLNCPTYPQPQNFSLGSFAGFFTYQEILNNLDSMAAKFPNIITVKQAISGGTTTQGRPLYYVKISDNPNTDEPEPEMLYNSLHHAREPASISQLIYYMWYLLDHYGSDATVDYLINNTELYFVPIVNPDGYLYNYSTNPGGGGMWRKNRRVNGDGTFGVDLNRNYDTYWGFDNVGSSPTTSSDTYRGPSAGSEPETQLMKGFINSHQFRISVNNHTYSDVLIFPFGYAANTFTPDSTQFSQYAELMTHCDGFGYGTPNQTVGYVGNGTIDDWLYADTIIRNKVLSFTPEAGAASDGFWPTQSRIIPICQNTTDQNIYAAKLIAVYGEAKNTDPLFIYHPSYNVNAHFDFTRLGMEPGTFTVNISPISANISATGTSKIYSGLNLLQKISDSISLTISNTIAVGDVVSYAIRVSNGGYEVSDTVVRYWGQSSIAFSDGCDAVSPQWTTTSWGGATSTFVSPTGSLTESVSGNYPNNTTRTITTTNFVDLTNALAAKLSFDAKWMLEAEYDYVEITASTDGINFTPLCGKYTKSGSSNQDVDNPLYDGYFKQWVNEEINLSSYVGNNVKFRFKFKSDAGGQFDGFYFDNFLVEKIVSVSAAIDEYNQGSVLLYPNPAQNSVIVSFQTGKIRTIQLYDVTGRIVKEITSTGSLEKIQTDNLTDGVYLLSVNEGSKPVYRSKLIVEKN